MFFKNVEVGFWWKTYWIVISFYVVTKKLEQLVNNRLVYHLKSVALFALHILNSSSLKMYKIKNTGSIREYALKYFAEREA